MNDNILDDDLAFDNPEVKKEKIKNLASKALDAVLIAAFIYFFFLLIDVKFIEVTNPMKKAFINDSLSIIHLLIAMIYLNYNTTKGNYKQNVKGGYYILLFGSGLFLLGASISLFEGTIKSLALEDTVNEYWSSNYQHLITLFIIFVKFLLIKPIALILEKAKKHVPTEK